MPVLDAIAGSSAAAAHNNTETSTGTGIAVPETSNTVTVDLSSAGWAGRIAGLKNQTKELREQRQRVAKELKAAQRKNKRLKERARCLSEEDMVHILVMKRTKSSANGSSEGGGSSTSGGASSSGIARAADGGPLAVDATSAVHAPLRADDELDDARPDV